MIYILAGNDTKKKNISLKKIVGEIIPMYLSQTEISKELINEYAQSVNLFGEQQVFIIEGVVANKSINFLTKDLEVLKESKTIFIFLEDKLLVADEKKYKKYASIEHFEEKGKPTSILSKPKFNTFAIADAYGRHDKVTAWILYREAIESGVEPESISGILFWKIKNMVLSPMESSSISTLQRYEGELVSLYHKAHRGEVDFVIGLEQFILSSLS